MKKGLIKVRQSSPKQRQEGYSDEYQLSRALTVAMEDYGYTRDDLLVVSDVHTATDEGRPEFDELFFLAEKHHLKHIFIFDIDRLTRCGPSHYEYIKGRLRELGCELVDVKGIIQPPKNHMVGSGGNFGNDFSYKWSVYSQSEGAEIQAAQDAKNEARKTLLRTIPVEISNAQRGCSTRPASYGYQNTKIVGEKGRLEASQTPIEAEAYFVIQIFNAAASKQNVRGICDKLNAEGFRTRTQNRWNKDKSRIIGTIGNKPLEPENFWKIVRRTEYAGFRYEKWTHYLPVRGNFEPLVSVDLWNQANQEYQSLIKDTQSPTGWKLFKHPQEGKRVYLMNNPDFPYKNFILCQKCGKPLKGCWSTSKNGQKIDYYFCGRGHKQISIRPKELHQILSEYLASIKFTSEAADFLETSIRTLWVDRVSELNANLITKDDRIKNLRIQADGLFEKIKLTNSPAIVKRLELEYEELESQIALLESQRSDQVQTESEINKLVKQARFIVEHIDQLVVNPQNKDLVPVFWQLIFPSLPTLEQIENRTPALSPIIEAKEQFETGKSELVDQLRFKLNKIIRELQRWDALLPCDFYQNCQDFQPISEKEHDKRFKLPSAA